MWSKKNKEKEEKKTVIKTETKHVSQTRQTLSVSTSYEQRRTSIGGIPSKITTYPSLGSNFSLGPPASSTNAYSVTDAKPINLNYQSPYRGSPVYHSFTSRGPITSRPTYQPSPSYHPPIPATVQKHSTPPSGKITVKKTGKFYDKNAAIPTYPTHSKDRGEVLIINNIMFKDKGQRLGAKKDDESLKTLFTQMGFNVTVKRDLKKRSMISAVKDFSVKGTLKKVDISIVIVMSHGTKNKTQGGTEVFGLDEEGVLADELIECFNENDCKAMANKPKIFIFQCCRGDNEQFIHTDAQLAPSRKSPLINALIAYSTLPGFVSHRNPDTGTWYIQTLCDVFSQHAHEYHIEDLLKMVDVQINSFYQDVKQTTHYENRGFKRCYLHPK